MKIVPVVAFAISCSTGVAIAQQPGRAAPPSDREISDSWIYLYDIDNIVRTLITFGGRIPS